MKYVVPAIACICLLLGSCRRDYTCDCHTDGSHIVRTNKLGRIPGEDAQNTCAKIQRNQAFDTCVLSSVK
ncbi:MAG: hypothetical protein V4649_07005 [Bacteroidota bacterium]